jgi:hypothetical protein
MQSSWHSAFNLELAQKILWVSGLAGLLGFLLATAVGHLSANQSDIGNAAKQVDTPSASAPLVMLHQRRDRLDRSKQPAVKADLLLDIMPASRTTDSLKQTPITRVEISSAPALERPRSLASWLEDETTVDTLTSAADRGPVVLIAPDMIDVETEGRLPLSETETVSSQHATGGTAGRAGKAASSLADRATGALGF